jgi:hypothetical protein
MVNIHPHSGSKEVFFVDDGKVPNTPVHFEAIPKEGEESESSQKMRRLLEFKTAIFELKQ